MSQGRVDRGPAGLFQGAASERLRLFHVSEKGGIDRFEPRAGPRGAALDPPRVWAVDLAHLAYYLLPRDCPRVCFRPAATTTETDRQRYFPVSVRPVVAIERCWAERARTTPLWLYELPAPPFRPEDGNAGYFVATDAVEPLAFRRIDAPLVELAALGAELRIVDELVTLASAVAGSSLSFSCIRMRNAAGG